MSDSVRTRQTTSRPDACTSGSTNETSPDVICVSVDPSMLTMRRLNVGGYGSVLPFEEL